MAAARPFFSWASIQNASSRVLNLLKQWNAPIPHMSAVAGVAIKPYHVMAFAFVAYRSIYAIRYALKCRANSAISRQRAEALQREVSRIPDLDLKIVPESTAQKLSTLSATKLTECLKKGQITAEQALLYYSAMAKESHRRFNCLTNVMFESALARARELDRILRETGRTVGPLHGLPVSIKECIAIKGTHSTAGLSSLLANISNEDAVIVRILKEAGAVIYVKTNIPQTMLISDCSNPIYGSTLNPYNPSRTPGGSSGGEGCLVASGGSPLGVGTDIGGSIRMPAAWCGIFGIKPTEGRFSMQGIAPELFPGIENLVATCGPLVKYTEDAVLFYNVVCNSQMTNLDPTVPPVQLDTVNLKSSKPLVIGYFIEDGQFTPSIACQRAVKLTVEKLKAKGHTLVEFKPHNVEAVIRSFFTFITGDGVWNLKKLLANEVVDPCIQQTWSGLTSPYPVRFTLYWLLKAVGWHTMTNILPIWAGSAQYEHQTSHFCSNYRRDLIRRMQDAQLDAIICPGPAVPPPLPNKSQLMAPALSYTYFWNVLKFPAASLSVTTVEDKDLSAPARSSWDSLTNVIANQGDIGSEGLPVPVQIVSYPYADETILRIAGELEPLMPDLSLKLTASIQHAVIGLASKSQ